MNDYRNPVSITLSKFSSMRLSAIAVISLNKPLILPKDTLSSGRSFPALSHFQCSNGPNQLGCCSGICIKLP